MRCGKDAVTMTQAAVNHVMATARESRLAREVLTELDSPETALRVEVGRDSGRKVALPTEISQVLLQVLEVMARGGTITIGTVPDVLTTSAAAKILGISRPTLMKQIAAGTIPSHMVGTHHRLKAEDVFAALRARRTRERASLEQLLELEGDED